MKLVKANLKELGKIRTKKSDRLKLLEEFAESDMDCAEVVNFTHKHATSCASSLNESIKRYHMTSIRAIQSGDRVYLVKTT